MFLCATAAVVADVVSFGSDPAATCFGLVFLFMLVTTTLLADADTSRRACDDGSSLAPFLFFFAVTASFSLLLSFGVFPQARNVKMNYKFLSTEMDVGSIDLFGRFMRISPLPFLAQLAHRLMT